MIDAEALLNDWKRTGRISTGPETAAYCTESFRRACTPRAPQKEWFWWLKWAHWQVIDKNGHVVYGRISLLARPGLHRDCECHTTPTLMCWALQYDKLMPIEMENHLVLPVTEFGPTIPVGWQVVE